MKREKIEGVEMEAARPAIFLREWRRGGRP
jgi:hypothetical protein